MRVNCTTVKVNPFSSMLVCHSGFWPIMDLLPVNHVHTHTTIHTLIHTYAQSGAVNESKIPLPKPQIWTRNVKKNQKTTTCGDGSEFLIRKLHNCAKWQPNKNGSDPKFRKGYARRTFKANQPISDLISPFFKKKSRSYINISFQ